MVCNISCNLVLLLLETPLLTTVQKQLCSNRAEHRVFTQAFASAIVFRTFLSLWKMRILCTAVVSWCCTPLSCSVSSFHMQQHSSAQLLVEPNNPVEFLAGGCFTLNKPFMFLLLLFPSILQTRNQEREEPELSSHAAESCTLPLGSLQNHFYKSSARCSSAV